MISSHELHCYDYVNRPYALVSQTLRARPREVFAGATKAATHRANDLASSLRMELGGLEIGADIAVEILAVETRARAGGRPEATVIKLGWKASRAPALFPAMTAELVAYALTASETQLELHGRYQPPLGALGSAVDSLVGHRVAEASVRSFVEDLARYLGVREQDAAP